MNAPFKKTHTASPDVITFGCRLNAYESAVMKGHAERAGLDDAIIINTCAVTNEAVRQARQSIRRMRRENPDAKIIVTGCAAQIDPDRFAAMDSVDYVIGNDDKMKAESYAAFNLDDVERVRVNDIMAVTETTPHMLDAFGDRARAFVQVQNGCDHRCTFCIIPYGRGNSRSVPMGDVVRHIQHLVDQGYLEVVLTGVDMTSYGADLPGTPNLGTLVDKILTLVPDLPRLRISSIDSIEVDDRLFHLITEEPRVMPHLHLSLQAGDDMILKRMKRRHTREDSIAFCKNVRRRRPDVTFGADLIAGFPTETEEMFENTFNLIDDCGLTFLHVFPYSARPGTPAARMPQVEGTIIKDRAARLRAKGHEVLSAHLAQQVGQKVDVLMETATRGRLQNFTPVLCEQDTHANGSLIRAGITGHTGTELIGRPIV